MHNQQVLILGNLNSISAVFDFFRRNENKRKVKIPCLFSKLHRKFHAEIEDL